MESIFSKRDVIIVDDFWNLILPMKEKITDSFYSKLFTLDDSIKPMFKIDLGVQGLKLTDTLTFIIKHMGNIEDTIPIVKELGVKHLDYGTKPYHYELVLEALIFSFEKHLEEKFTTDMRLCWIKLYKFLSELMMLGKPTT